MTYLRSPRRRHRRGRSLMFFEVRLPRRQKVMGCFVLPPFRPNLPHLVWLLREEVLNQNLNGKEKKNAAPGRLLQWKRASRRRGARPNPLPRVPAFRCRKSFGNKWPRTLPRKLAIRNRSVRRLPMSAVPGSRSRSRVLAVPGSRARSPSLAAPGSRTRVLQPPRVRKALLPLQVKP